MRLAPAIKLLQAPLRGCVVPKAHISAKPAKTPVSPQVGAEPPAGRAGVGQATLICSQDEAGFRVRDRRPGWEERPLRC